MMRCMILDAARRPLRMASLAVPAPGPGHLLIRVHACAVCRTDLHVVDGELAEPKLALIPGHEIVGRVAASAPASSASRSATGSACHGWAGPAANAACRSGRENLCEQARFTGYQIDGGYAEFTVADQRFCFAIPAAYGDIEAAPLLCAGLIGYRSLRMAGDARRLGLYGFGAAAHIIAQVARRQGREVYAFTRPGDTAAQHSPSNSVRLGGRLGPAAARTLDAAIIFAPVGPLVPAALRPSSKGGTVVCAGIHMSDIPAFPTISCGVSGSCGRSPI